MGIFNVAEQEWEEWRPGTWSRMWTSELIGAEEARTGEQYHAVGIGAPRHTHPYEEHLLFTQGKAEMYYGDETHTVDAPFSVIIPAGVVHGFTNVGFEPLHLFVAISQSTLEATFVDEPDDLHRQYGKSTDGTRQVFSLSEDASHPSP